MDISLRQWKVSDAPNLAAGLSNLKILNNLRDGLPYPYTEKDALAFISEVSSKPDKIYAFAVESDGVLAGSVGVYRKDNIHFRSAEIGYYLFENFWGKGIATKAVKVGYKE